MTNVTPVEALELGRSRMLRQGLWGEPFTDPADVVRAFAAMQAQEFLPAKWAISQRSHGVTDTEVDAAVADGSILRTHVLRPTWHFVHRDDIRWMLAVSAPRVHQLNAPYYRKTGLDAAATASTQEVLRAELSGGRQRTRAELAAALATSGHEVAGLALAYVLMRAELDGVVISGARRGRQHTYALFDDRVPPAAAGDPADPDGALTELTVRYLAMRGPATVKDFATWASLTTAQVRAGLELAGRLVRRLEVDDLVLYDLSAPMDRHRRAKATRVDLLQGYDEYVMSYSQTRIAALSARDGGGRPDFLHTIVADGRLVGRWKHTTTAAAVTVHVQLHRALTPEEDRALDASVVRFGIFLGLAARRA